MKASAPEKGDHKEERDDGAGAAGRSLGRDELRAAFERKGVRVRIGRLVSGHAVDNRNHSLATPS